MEHQAQFPFKNLFTSIHIDNYRYEDFSTITTRIFDIDCIFTEIENANNKVLKIKCNNSSKPGVKFGFYQYTYVFINMRLIRSVKIPKKIFILVS